MTAKNERRSRYVFMASAPPPERHVFCSQPTRLTTLKTWQCQSAYRPTREGTDSHDEWPSRQDRVKPRDNVLIVVCILLVLTVYMTLQG